MESSLSSDTEDEVFFGPILAKESQIASKLRRRTELFDPTFRNKRVASCSHSSNSPSETSLSDVFVEEPSASTTNSPKSPILPKSHGFIDENPVMDSPLPRDVERAKSEDTADDQKESPFQMKGKALLDLIYKTKEEWSSPTQSPRNTGMTGSGTRSPIKRRIIPSLTSDSYESCSEKVPKYTSDSLLDNDTSKVGEPSFDNSGALSEKLPNTITGVGKDENGDNEMSNEDELNYGLKQSNVSESEKHLLRRENVAIPICKNLSNAFKETSKTVVQVKDGCQQDGSISDWSSQEDDIARGEELWEENARKKQNGDSIESLESENEEISVSDASIANNAGNQESSSILNSEAISSIHHRVSLDSSVWSEYLSEQDQTGESKLDVQKEEISPEISANKSCSVCQDASNERKENSPHQVVNENSLVIAPLSAFTKVSSESTLGQIPGASLKELSFRKFTPSMSSSPRSSAFSSPRELSRKDLSIAEGVNLESGSVLQDSTNLIQQVDSPKYFPAITMVDKNKNDSVQECVSSPEPARMSTPLKTEEAYAHSRPQLNPEAHTSLCQNYHGSSPTVCYVSSPQHQNVTKLQSDSPLRLRRLLEQKRIQLMKLKQAKEEMMQKLTEDNKHFSLQVENALALRQNMASLEDIQQSPLLRENISRLESSPPECLDENSFDELTLFYTWKNSQHVIGDGSPYNSSLTDNAINRKTNRPHLRWVENLVVDVTELSSPSKPATRRKSILLKRM